MAQRRILHVIDQGGPGGAQAVLLELAVGLRCEGLEPIVVVNCDDWLARELRTRHIAPHIVPSSGSLNLSYLQALRRLISTERPGLVVAHLLGPSVYCSLAASLSGIPVVSVFHGQTDVSPTERYLSLKAAVLQIGASKVVYVSERLRKALQPRLRIPASKTSVIPNGIDLKKVIDAPISPVREQLGIPQDSFLIGAVGHVRPEKGYDLLLRAARIALDAEPGIHFIVAGDTRTPHYAELQALVIELGVGGRVHFLGMRSDVPGLLKAVDLFVLSSKSEGFSIACCEAMAARVPVVATESGGPEEILDGGRCGLLVPNDSPEKLANSIVSICRRPEDGCAMASTAFERVSRHYSIESMLDTYSRLCSTLTETT